MSTVILTQYAARPVRPGSLVDGVARRRRDGRRGTVRLTRRGRVVVLILACLILASVGLLGASVAGASGDAGDLPTRAVTVTPGDTLWDLASSAAHGGDVLAMEQKIKDINALTSSMLIAGQHLRIPQ